MIHKTQQIACFSLFLLLFGLSVSQAWAAEVFEVKGVYVDVTAENVVQAREKAMREGLGRAFDLLLKRLTLKADRDLLPWVEPNQRAQYLRDFSVSGEKSSSVRYLATYTYHFKADAIRNLLKSRGIAFAETVSKPVLVLPLYEDGSRLVLWEDPNPWRAVWSQRDLENGLVPLALPLGDLADISGLSAQQARTSAPEALQDMSARYDVSSVVVAHLSVTGRDVDGNPTAADLIMNRVGSRYEGRTTQLGLSAQEGESSQDFLMRVAGLVNDQLEETWKQDNLLQFNQAGVLPVNLSINGLPEWLSVKKRLQRVAVIRDVELALMARDTVQLNLHFIGTLDQLIGSLRQVDLDLTLQGESWALVNAGEGSRS